MSKIELEEQHTPVLQNNSIIPKISFIKKEGLKNLNVKMISYHLQKWNDVANNWEDIETKYVEDIANDNTLLFTSITYPEIQTSYRIVRMVLQAPQRGATTRELCESNVVDEFKLPFVSVWVGKNSTEWETKANWRDELIPSTGSSIKFDENAYNNLVVPSEDSKTIYNMINNSTKSIIISAGSSLIVKGEAKGSESLEKSYKIRIKSEQNKSNGTLILSGQCGKSDVYGTVEMYSKANKKEFPESWVDNLDGSPTKGETITSSYTNQYFGVPVEKVSANPTFYGSFISKYSEVNNSDNAYYNKWTPINIYDDLYAFYAYVIRQDNPTTYEIQGKLNYCDQEITLTRKAKAVGKSKDKNNINNKHYGLGQNVFGNSFTASIDISKIKFPPHVEKTVYLYNTGSFVDWAKSDDKIKPDEGKDVQRAGSYIAIPINMAKHMSYGEIPSMNGFLLLHKGKNDNNSTKDDDDIKLTLSYNKVTKSNTKPQTAIRKGVSYLEFSLNSISTIDKLWLIEQDGTTEQFDEGWDGRKFFGTPTAFIYTAIADKNLQVDAKSNIDDTYITFYPNQDTDYTLSIKTTEMPDRDDLWLIDLRNGTKTQLNQDTVNYSFTSTSHNVSEKRFKIVRIEDGSTTEPKSDNEVSSDYLDGYLSPNGELVISNYTGDRAVATLLDVAGKTIVSYSITADITTISTENLPSGVYMLNITSGDKQITKKVVK